MSDSAQHPPLPVQLQERFKQGSKDALQAVTSFAWLWPFRGIIYSVSHPVLFTSVRAALLKSLLISTVIFVLLLVVAFIPQMALLAVITGPLAPVIAFILVLAESVLAITLFARPLFLEPALMQVFDSTLIQRGQKELVVQGRRSVDGGSNSRDIGRALVQPLQGFSKDGILQYILTLPLNLVPVVGTAFFVLFNGSRQGPGWHSRYFQLKGLTKSQRQAFIEKRRPEYTAFGATTLLLNFVPVVGLVFSFTNTVGAAMWAADMEAAENLIDGRDAKETSKTK